METLFCLTASFEMFVVCVYKALLHSWVIDFTFSMSTAPVHFN